MYLIRTLEVTHAYFNEAEENTYVIRTYPGFRRGLIRDLPLANEDNERLVKFEKHSNCDLSSRVLLDTHAAIAKILHSSGRRRILTGFFKIGNTFDAWRLTGVQIWRNSCRYIYIPR